ncbi:MAG: S-layer homology domain-containing protein, partial [Anaerotignum sp.]|nr:S-layer homology domain-containing protein [Anaerotignum sp.]
MKYRKTARPIVLALAAMLAIPPVSASAITFADINQVPWPGAEVPINKAAELKLVVGETINGKNYFKPKDPVSLTQTCQLAYKLLLETGKAKADASLQEKWSTVMNTYKIQSWAFPAVSFCLENEIISIGDLSGFISGEVNRSATREQAAEILGRALTVGVPSKKATATSTNFKDNASISKDAIPYIALLNAEKIVNGDDLGKFNPKNTLNRTETAVMVTNLYEKLKSAVVVPEVTKPTSASGKIADMNKAYVNFENSTAYYLYSPSGVTVTLNGSASSTAALIDLFKTGTAINASLTLDSDARITKLAATSEKVLEETEEKDTEGTLTTMKYDDEDDDGKITLNGKSTYNVENDYVSIEIDDEDYDLEDLYELYKECKDDDKKITVKLTLDKDGDIRKIVGKIKNADGKSEGDVEGILTDVDYDEDDEEGEIEIDNDDEYDFDDSTDIEIDGKKADWEDLMDLFEEAEDDDEELEVILFLDDDDFATSIEVYTEDYEPEEDKDEAKGTVDEVT